MLGPLIEVLVCSARYSRTDLAHLSSFLSDILRDKISREGAVYVCNPGLKVGERVKNERKQVVQPVLVLQLDTGYL